MRNFVLVDISDLEGEALNWAVWRAEYERVNKWSDDLLLFALDPDYAPSTNWAYGGPIIEREGITVSKRAWDVDSGNVMEWSAVRRTCDMAQIGNTYLIAAMRCHVASGLGNEIEIPAELVRKPSKGAHP